MPAVTSIIAAAGAAASAGQAVAANQRRKKDETAAKEAASRLRGLTETDYSAGLQVPTMGYDLAQQGIQQQQASGIQALQEAGAAGVIGGVPSMNQAANEAQLQLSADLQQAEYNRDLYRSQNRQGIEGRKMEREFDLGASELQGAQMSALQNKQMVNQGVAGAFSGLTSMGESIAANQDLYKEQKLAADLSQIKPMGITTTAKQVVPKSPYTPAPGLSYPAGVMGGSRRVNPANMRMNSDGTFSFID
jgi:hypothetical protein